MSRHSARRWVVTTLILTMGLTTIGTFPANGLAAGEPTASPPPPFAAPDGGRSPAVVGDVQIFPLDEVRPGLHGVAKTVVHGTTVETFDVEVLSVLENAAPAGDLILIRVSGPVVERTGGIASGMSGSPVYIDGRLLGAIGYGFDMADPTIGMVTPIASMQSVLELLPGYRSATEAGDAVVGDVTSSTGGAQGSRYGAKGDSDGATHFATLHRPVTVGGRVIKDVAFATNREQAQALREKFGPDVSVMQPVATPLLAAGWGERALSVLNERLADYPVSIVGRGGLAGGGIGIPVGSTRDRDATSFLGGEAGDGWTAEPGAAFGVQLVRGDVSLNAIGTITAVDGDAFVGFGHPFLNMGATELYATGATIHAVVDSLTTPFKIGSVLDPIGTIFQDRSAAVAGKLGANPSWIPIEIQVQDEGTRSIRLTRAEVADNPQLAVALAASAALEGFDQSIDRIGPGTAEVTFEIEATGLPTKFVRTNMFYSPTDVSASALTEMVTGLDLLVTNPFQELEIRQVNLDAKVTEARHTAQIEEAHPTNDEVRAGETVDVEVMIRPFRQEPVTKVVPLQIPADTSTGDVVVTVRGGGIYFVPMDYGLPSAVPGSPPPVEPPVPDEDDEDEAEGDEATGNLAGSASGNLEEVVTAFVEKERNNELIAEFYPPYQYGPPDGDVGADPSVDAPQAGAEGGPDAESSHSDEELAEPPTEEADTDSGDIPAEPIRSRVTTQYVMEGQQHFSLHILPPMSPSEAHDETEDAGAR